MPLRKPSSNGRNIIGKMPSVKMKRMINFESLIECDMAYILDYAPNVISFEEQAPLIDFEAKGKTHRYIPDFLVHLIQNRTLILECKPDSLVDTEENQRKL